MSSSEERDSEQQPPYLDPSLVIDTRLSEIERQQREEKAEQRQHNRSQRTTNWLLTVFTGLLFVASLASDVLIIRQVRLAGKSADAATESAHAAQRAVVLSESNAKDAERTFRLQMRPYIVLSGVDPTSVKLIAGNNTITLSVKDIGRTPGIQMEVVSLDAFLGKLKLPKIASRLRSRSPVADQAITVPFTFILTSEQVEVVMKSRSRLYIKHQIRYLDIFMDSHNTWISLEFDPASSRFGYGDENKIE